MKGHYEYGHYVAPNGLHYDSYKEYKEEEIMNIDINNVTVAEVAETTNNTLKVKEDDTMTNMTAMTVKKLRERAKELKISRYSKMNKADLIAAIKFFTDEERKAKESVVAPVIEESVEVGDLSITKDNVPVKDNKEQRWDKLLLSMQRQYIAQSYEKTAYSYNYNKKKYKALFYRTEEEIKEEGDRAVYHVVAKRLWAVTAMIIDKLYGKGTANEDNILQTINKLLERGIISKLEEVKEGQTRYYVTPQQMERMKKKVR